MKISNDEKNALERANSQRTEKARERKSTTTVDGNGEKNNSNNNDNDNDDDDNGVDIPHIRIIS